MIKITRKKEGFIEFNSWQTIGNGADPSFLSNRAAMAYFIETANGHYLPASFNIGSELKVKYEHPKCVTITMRKGINDIPVNEAKAAIQNFK